MAKATAKTTTKRARQSKKISKQRAEQKRRQERFRRIALGGVIAFTLMGGGFSWWAVSSGQVEAWSSGAEEAVWGVTQSAGFSLQRVYLSGHSKVATNQVMALLPLRYGDPILAVSLNDIKARLETLPWVQSAELSRALPHDLHIHITERQPVAIWQKRGGLHLIDAEGMVLDAVGADQYRYLPLLVGENSNQQITRLFKILKQRPELLREVESAVYVGQRRWNIAFKQGLTIKLPEKKPELAWNKFADLQERERLLDRNIQTIDLRLPDRYFITVPEIKPPVESQRT